MAVFSGESTQGVLVSKKVTVSSDGFPKNNTQSTYLFQWGAIRYLYWDFIMMCVKNALSYIENVCSIHNELLTKQND